MNSSILDPVPYWSQPVVEASHVRYNGYFAGQKVRTVCRMCWDAGSAVELGCKELDCGNICRFPGDAERQPVHIPGVNRYELTCPKCNSKYYE